MILLGSLFFTRDFLNGDSSAGKHYGPELVNIDFR